MTYLNPIRLHFAGQFQADPSTVNNDIRHYDTSQVQPGWQQLETDFDPTTNAYTNPNGWWNPDGSGSFRLVGCTVTSVAYLEGTTPTTSTTDSIVGMQIMGANTRVAGKLVDLDPQQQMVSQIWGMLVRLTNGTTDLLSGPFAAAPFTDMWNRALGPGSAGDIGASAVYQSVIGPVTWGDPGDSTLLKQLIAAAPDGYLSIKFNVDSYNMNIGTPGFTLGRCVGTIGPASQSEPQFFTLGRHLLPSFAFDTTNDVANPVGPMYFMPCTVQGSTLYADFGNALPTTTPGSDMSPIGTVQLGWLDASDNFNGLVTLDNYTNAGWYEQTAGIQAFTIDPSVIQSNPLAVSVVVNTPLGVSPVAMTTLMENTGGIHVRADNFVYRVNANEPANVTVWGTQYGTPAAGIQISVAADTTQLQGGAPTNDPLTNNISVADPAQPAGIISFPDTLTTAANGQVTLTIGTTNPNTPRGYIDGQIFGIRCLPAATAAAIGNPPAILSDQSTPMTAFGFDPWDFVSLLVWDEYDQPATWASVAPILAQYAVLYPVMDQLIDLTSETEVNQQAALLQLVFGLPVTDPNSMPVTRDLSDPKRAMLLQYLGAQVVAAPSPTVVGAAPQGKPVIIRRKVAAKPPQFSATPGAAAADGVSTKDSKTLAMRNRLGNRRIGNK